jgi:hypothetical protein
VEGSEPRAWDADEEHEEAILPVDIKGRDEVLVVLLVGFHNDAVEVDVDADEGVVVCVCVHEKGPTKTGVAGRDLFSFSASFMSACKAGFGLWEATHLTTSASESKS